MPEWTSLRQAAKLSGKSQWTIQSSAVIGLVRVLVLPGRHVLYYRDDVLALANKHHAPQPRGAA